MIPKFKVGDRLNDNALGSGTVTELVKSGLTGETLGYIVMFDKTPDVRYNCGHNPTLIFHSNDLSEVE